MTLLLESTIKISVVVAVGLLAVVALRNRSAAMRHWVLAAALVCAAATPILLPVAPAWTLFDSTPSGSRASDRRPSTIAVPSRDGATRFEPVTAMEPLVSIGRIPNAATFLAVIWLAGIGVKVAVLLFGLSVLRQHSIRAAEVTGGLWIEIARETAHVFGLRRRIRVLRGDHPTLLATWGVRAPRVLLPASSSDWPEDRIRIVLAHELAHIARRDWAVQIGAELLCSIYWFNPLLWIAASRLRLESEHACDDAVVTLGIGAREYATHLVELARMLGTNGRTWLPAFAIAARPSTLERRVNAMLSTHINRRPLTRTVRATALLALLVLALWVAGGGMFAQGGAALSGGVYDPSGAPIPNAILVLSIASEPTLSPTSNNPIKLRFTNAPLTNVLTFVGLASGIGVSYEASVQDRPVSVQVEGAPLEQALDEILLPIDLSYRALNERAILVVPADAQDTTRRAARTDQNGRYEIAGMRSGDYRLRAIVLGFSADRLDVVLQGGQNVDRDLRLRIGAIEETVTVQTDVEQRPPSRPDPSGLRELIARFQGKRIQPPIKVGDARPVYPATLRDEGIEGTVMLEGRIGPSGFLQDLKVVGSAHPDFERAALDAVNQWQFEPTRLWGVPTDTQINVTVRFRRQQ